MNARRGHESSSHLKAKTVIGQLFSGPEWSIFYEQCNADILVMHNATRFVAAIEIESTPRNVLRNLERNISNNCHAVGVVALNLRYLNQISNKVQSGELARNHGHIRVFPFDPSSRQELLDWLTKLARSDASSPQENPHRNQNQLPLKPNQINQRNNP